MPAEHMRIRKELREQSLGFGAALVQAKAQFPELKTQRAAKKARTTKIKEEIDLISDSCTSVLVGS